MPLHQRASIGQAGDIRIVGGPDLRLMIAIIRHRSEAVRALCRSACPACRCRVARRTRLRIADIDLYARDLRGLSIRRCATTLDSSTTCDARRVHASYLMILIEGPAAAQKGSVLPDQHRRAAIFSRCLAFSCASPGTRATVNAPVSLHQTSYLHSKPADSHTSTWRPFFL
jgi:hypothetical protein